MIAKKAGAEVVKQVKNALTQWVTISWPTGEHFTTPFTYTCTHIHTRVARLSKLVEMKCNALRTVFERSYNAIM